MGRKGKGKAFLKKQLSKRKKSKTISKKKKQLNTTTDNKSSAKSKSNAKSKSLKKMDKFNAQFNEELINAHNVDKALPGISAATLNLNHHTIDISHDLYNNSNNSNNSYEDSSYDDDPMASDSDTESHRSLQSTITIIAEDFINLNEERSALDELDDNFLMLKSKNVNDRVQALAHINHALRRRVFDDYLNLKNRMQLLYSMLQVCVRKGSSNEQSKAIETVGLVCLSLQSGQEFFVGNFQPILLKIIRSPTCQNAQLKAIEVWSCMTWITDDMGHKYQNLRSLEGIWQFNMKHKREIEEYHEYKAHQTDYEDEDEDDSEIPIGTQPISSVVCTAALKAWLFLVCSIEDSTAIASLLDSYHKELSYLLKCNDLELKITAARALTVLIESYNFALQNDAEFEKQNVNVDKLIHKFKQNTSSASRTNRTQSNLLRRKFRDFLQTLESSWTPTIQIKLRGKKYVLKGWNVWIQYHFIKQLLANGLQPHLLENNKLKQRFGIEINTGIHSLSKLEKSQQAYQHEMRQKNTKQERNHQRRNKMAKLYTKDLIS